MRCEWLCFGMTYGRPSRIVENQNDDIVTETRSNRATSTYTLIVLQLATACPCPLTHIYAIMVVDPATPANLSIITRLRLECFEA